MVNDLKKKSYSFAIHAIYSYSLFFSFWGNNFSDLIKFRGCSVKILQKQILKEETVFLKHTLAHRSKSGIWVKPTLISRILLKWLSAINLKDINDMKEIQKYAGGKTHIEANFGCYVSIENVKNGAVYF